MALKHEFAWSASRHAGFRKCLRAHYYAYYLSWGGWERGASPERVAARTQHKLTTMNAVAGSAIHTVLAESMSLEPQHRMKETEAVDRATQALRRAYKESRDGLWKRSLARYAYLAEHFYEDSRLATRAATSEYGAKFVERIRICFRHFFTLPELAPIREASGESLLFVEDPSPDGGFESFDYEGTKVFASPDLIYRDTRGVAHIYDWKTGQASDDDEFQLLTYAIQAREKYGLEPQKVRAFDVYLGEGRVREWEITEASVAAAEDEIRASMAAMRALHFDADQSEGDPEAFARIALEDPKARLCASCRFRRICGRERSAS